MAADPSPKRIGNFTGQKLTPEFPVLKFPPEMLLRFPNLKKAVDEHETAVRVWVRNNTFVNNS